MILRMDFQRAGTIREGFLALHRVDDCWVAIDNIADPTVEQAIERCRDHICGLLDGLSELAMHEAERGGFGESPDRQALLVALWQGIEQVYEAVSRLWDEPEESDPVLLPALVVFAPVSEDPGSELSNHGRDEHPGDGGDHDEQ